MKGIDIVGIIMKCSIDQHKKKIIEQKYCCELPEIVSKIITVAEEPIFFNSNRILSFDEICEAEEEFNVSFIEKQMIPLIDCSDNDFIVYHFDSKKWSKFNIVDECVFKEKESLYELLK